MWVTIGERLARFTRELLSANKDYCLTLYRTESADLITSLTNKDLYAILRRANQYRNNWVGHSGKANEKEDSSRLEILEWELANVEGVLTPQGISPNGPYFHSHFEDSLLIIPRSSEYDGRVYDYEADLLQGSNMIFRQVHVESLEPIKTGNIYLLQPRLRRPLEIIPFFRIKPSPRIDQKACYFYNRVEKGSVRRVSYHFGDESVIIEPDDEIIRIVEELEQPF